jgi:hypothetical protein
VFNSRRLSSKCRFVDKDDKKVAALLLHVTGVEARQPCSRCASGSGVFSGCVKLSPNASVGDNIRNCANCWYSHQACTYETSPADNQNTSATERDRIPAKDESVLQATDSDEEEEEDDSDRIRDAPETTATGAAKPQAIIRAPSGRPYGKWPGKPTSYRLLSRLCRTDHFPRSLRQSQDDDGQCASARRLYA